MPRGSRPTPPAAIKRAWAWRAATSTVTASADLAVTNFYGESTTFFQDLGHGVFADRTAALGLAAPSRSKLGFGIAFLDANNDGRLDLLTANGHVTDYRPEFAYTMPAQLLIGDGRRRLTDISDRAGPPFQALHLGRGLAIGDLDNDGRTDALLVAADEPLVLLHNVTDGGHSLTLRLEGTASNRDAVGARVTLTALGAGRSSPDSAAAATCRRPIPGSMSDWAGPGVPNSSRSPGRRDALIATATSSPIEPTCSVKARPRQGRSRGGTYGRAGVDRNRSE